MLTKVFEVRYWLVFLLFCKMPLSIRDLQLGSSTLKSKRLRSLKVNKVKSRTQRSNLTKTRIITLQK